MGGGKRTIAPDLWTRYRPDFVGQIFRWEILELQRGLRKGGMLDL
jgi:hypothetical protein